MSEWPEALVEKVARFLHDRHCRCGSDQVVSTDAEDARHLLDALELREETGQRFGTWHGRTVEVKTQARFVTPWGDV